MAHSQDRFLRSSRRSWLSLVTLILAGEVIFGLPFHIARYFRPTLLAALEATQTQWGVLQSAYGLAAMVSYFPGGLLADRFAPRTLLLISLLSTALGGLYFAMLPGFAGLLGLHIYWGITTVLFLWSPLIRATRDWGTPTTQGRAFGILDSGRGVVAAGLATVGVGLLSAGTQSSGADPHTSIRHIIVLYTAATGFVGALVFVGLPRVPPKTPAQDSAPRLSCVLSLVRSSQLISHAGVVVCAYSAFRGIDYYATYATSVFGWSDVQGAQLATVSVWTRPLAALAAGLMADRFSARRLCLLSFMSLAIAYVVAALFSTAQAPAFFIWLIVLSTSTLIFGFRALYYALLEENAVPPNATGTAVGFVSLVGYTPDFFFPAITGAVIDSGNGELGYARLFWLLASLATLGAILCWRPQRAR